MELKNNPGLLLHKIGALMERASDQVLFDEFGIGFSQFKILFALQHHQDVQQKQIAHFLGQTEASVSRQIKLMKSAKFIEIRLGSDDKKKHHITLTARGSGVAKDALGILNAHYEPILAVLSAHEQLDLAPKLSKIHDRLESDCRAS